MRQVAIPFVRAARFAIAVVATAAILGSMNAPAWAAASSPLVGLWSMTVKNRDGQTLSVVLDEFSPDGKIHVRFITSAGTVDYYGVYQVDDDGASVAARFDDYEPKQICATFCSPVMPVFSMGQTTTSPVRFDGANTMYLGADRYNRQL